MKLEDLTCNVSNSSCHQSLSGDEELQSSPKISTWEGCDKYNYDAAWIAKEVVKTRREFQKYLSVVRKNMKILHNRSCILEDELFMHVLKYIGAQVFILDSFRESKIKLYTATGAFRFAWAV